MNASSRRLWVQSVVFPLRWPPSQQKAFLSQNFGKLFFANSSIFHTLVIKLEVPTTVPIAALLRRATIPSTKLILHSSRQSTDSILHGEEGVARLYLPLRAE
jgi:hypothetical protein